MDTTAEYIKMCGKSGIEWETPAIATCHIKEGSLYHYGDNVYIKIGEDLVPLFRQDQLQEMIKGDFIEMCDYISHYTEKFVELKTPEKILLKIVMEENYHKTWDGEEWATTPKQ